MAEKLRLHTEGAIRFYGYVGPLTSISKRARVFYNPEMRLSRDVSVAALKVWRNDKKPRPVVAEVLAATGIRGLRYAKEAGPFELILNDANPSAVRLMRRNARLNGIKANISRDEANVLLSRRKDHIDVVDIDPFGSPMGFLDSAARAVGYDGLLMITATDTAPLAGTYPTTCLRRYGAMPLRTDNQHEIGVRILAAVAARELARYDKAFVPILCFLHRHSYRIIAAVKKSKTLANGVLQNIGYELYCLNCGWRSFSKIPDSEACPTCHKNLVGGPLWAGRLFDAKFAKSTAKFAEDSAMPLDTQKFLAGIAKEATVWPSQIYDLHYLCRKYSCGEPPAVEKFIAALKKSGFRAVRTHFSANGVRTNAPLAALVRNLPSKKKAR